MEEAHVYLEKAHVFMKKSLPIKMDAKVSGALAHYRGALHCLEDAPYLEMGASYFSPRFAYLEILHQI